MSNKEGGAKTLDLLFWKDWSCLLFLPQAPRWPKARGLLVAVVTLATHFLINTQTRTPCLLRVEPSSLFVRAWQKQSLNQRL